jgi:hypothetical protein
MGGSESVTREAAVGFAARHWDVEVLTTRVVDHYTSANDLRRYRMATGGC